MTDITARPLIAALALASASTLNPVAAAGGSATPDLGWAPGRVLLLPRAGTSETALADIVRVPGSRVARLGRSELRLLQLPAGVSETAVQARLARHPGLKFAELDRRVAPSLVANDPYLGSEWHVPQVKAPAAWDVSQGAGITIAILDSGVLATHPDLQAKLVAGWNFYDNTSNTADATGHGTAVAGAAAAATNNATGVAGIAGAAKIMPIRVSDATGYAYYSTIAQGVTWAADHGARVANASFSGIFTSSSVDSAGQYLKSKGGLLMVAAGNNGINEGNYAPTGMIVVSATDSSDALASWSSYGPFVALSAPGVGIWTTSSDGTWRSASGTSFSSPIAAGVAALVMAAQPGLSASQVESVLYKSAVDLGAGGRDIYFGYGRVDAAAAVGAATTTLAADTVAPTVGITSPAGGTSVSGAVAIDASASDNVGVVRVDLKVNGSTVASDTTSPYQFTWDSTKAANGGVTLTAVAVDAAGNSQTSAPVTVTVANASTDVTPPTVTIRSPINGSLVSGSKVTVSTSATDDAGTTGLKQTLTINGSTMATATGGTLSYNWNTRKLASGIYTLQVMAVDAAGNRTSTSVQVQH